MKELLQKKLFLPLMLLALVGVSGSVYTLSHTGPLTAHAQTSTSSTGKQAATDTETKDDVISTAPAQSFQPVKTEQKDAADITDPSSSTDPADAPSQQEVQDGK